MTLLNNVVDSIARMLDRNDAEQLIDAHKRGVLTKRDLQEYQRLYARMKNVLQATKRADWRKVEW